MRRIITGDATRLPLASESVNLTITSPPYNVGMEYGNSSDCRPYSEYLDWCAQWLEELYRVTVEDGRLCINLPLDTASGGAVYSDILQVAKREGWAYFTSIVWNEGTISNRLAWGSFMSPSAPHVITPVEMVVVLYKNVWARKANLTPTIRRQDFIDWTNGLWTFSGESANRVKHVAPFPIELPRRLIELFSYQEDTILDPFCGSGSTLVAAKITGRKAIGIDNCHVYNVRADARVRAVAKQEEMMFS